MAVWALSMASRRSDRKEDLARAFLLEKATTKCMRGLLTSMICQREKVEKFKSSLSEKDSLHAKYCSKTGGPVVDDDGWGHLQIDAVSLYLLTLAQMTASGLQIIFTLDEVAFIQNLVFYIETAYITPDYGVWERGAKSNQGIRELNASSIGMAKAALEAVNKLDLFGSNGSPLSVIHIMPDEVARCSAILDSMLPRESNSKETDSAILSIVGFPAFAVSNQKRIENTVETIQNKLGGRYGFKRFLRDGYKTLKEDTKRLHYEPWELRVFDNIECEWPLFYCYLSLLHYFTGNMEESHAFSELLDQLTVASNGLKFLPELYMVTEENMVTELANPGTTDRSPGGRCPFMWAQSLYVISKLLLDDYLAPGELDPLNRRLSSVRKPDVVVQVVVLVEDKHVQDLLKDQGILLETVDDISPIVVKPAAMLSRLISFLGKSNKLGLSGRNNNDVGILTTSKIFKIHLGGELLLESLASILLSSHLAGSLGTVVGTGLGALRHDLFPGPGLKVDQADVGVLEPNPLHGLNIGATAALKLGKGGVHVLEILVELLLGAGLNVSSLASLQDNSTLVTLLVKILVEEHALVSDKGHVDSGREEKEGEDTLPGLDNTIGHNSEDEVEPDIGEYRPGGSDGEHTEALDLPDLVVGDDVHAETDDHEQVEGSRADNCSGSEVSGPEVLGHDLNDGQHDLGGRRSQSHEGQVGNSVVPDLDNDSLGLAGCGILDGDLLLLTSDGLNGLHELVRGNGDSNEEVDHEGDVEHTTSKSVSHTHLFVSLPDRDDETIITIDSFICCSADFSLLIVIIVILSEGADHQERYNTPSKQIPRTGRHDCAEEKIPVTPLSLSHSPTLRSLLFICQGCGCCCILWCGVTKCGR